MKEPIYTSKQIKLIFATSMALWIPLAYFLYTIADKWTENQVILLTCIVVPILVIILFVISDRWIRNLK